LSDCLEYLPNIGHSFQLKIFSCRKSGVYHSAVEDVDNMHD